MTTPDNKSSSEPMAEQETQVCDLHINEGLRAGMICPRCQTGIIDYNGLLNLVCPHCDLTEAGACT